MASKQVIDDKIKAAIDNYGDQIKTLEDFITAVRTRPGMYIGPIGNAGFLNMIREIFQNSADQKMDVTSPCDTIWVDIDMTSLTVMVMDNGKGLPFNDIMRIITEPHTSKNFTKKPYEYSSGLNGIGAKVVNALSEYFLVESFRYDGTAVKVEFKDGYATTKAPVKIPNKEKFQGTRITFTPHLDTMKEINMDWKAAYHLIRQITSLLPIGTLVKFRATDYKGKVFTEDIINKDGIISDLIHKCKHPIIKPIVIGNDDGFHKLDIAICYDFGDGITGPDEVENITAFSNMCPTTKGTHIEGSIEGICRWFSTYMNNIYLINQKAKDKLKVNFNDIRNGLNIMISAAHLDPEFTGQAKEILSNADMAPFCKDTVMKGLDEWSKNNPADLAKMAKFFKDIAEIRQKGEKEKDKIIQKYAPNPLTNLPKKYKRPLDKDGVELIIVEGDSALGSVEKARNVHKQGIFPIRGKFPNAFQKSFKDFWGNEEVQGIRSIIFGGAAYKRNFDISECKVSKVIILSDADVDGAHIAALLLRMFVMYYPQMVQAGMIFKAIPPLYSVPNGKGKRYFTENIDMIRYNQKTFLSQHTLAYKGTDLAPKEVTSFLLKNTDYLYYMDNLSATYPLEPKLLDIMLVNYVENGKFVAKKIDKEIHKFPQYRFINVEDKGGNVVISGDSTKSQFGVGGDKLLHDARFVIDILRDNKSCRYTMDGKEATILDIMNVYKTTEPARVQRYKGLGEMDFRDLAESTIDASKDRTLIRYTMQDAKEEIEAIREYESNTKKILTLAGTITREDLLD